MSKTYLGHVFDEELFLQRWNTEPDPIKNALLTSGVMRSDATIAGMIANHGNFGTVPFYNTLEGEPVNYDGQTDIPSSETTSDSQSWVCFGRARGFTARDFMGELSGSDPMDHIIGSVANWWAKYRQRVLIGMLNGLFNIEGDAAWAKHTVDTGAPMGITTLNDAAVETLGDNKNAYSLAIMHSHTARSLDTLEVMEFWKHTDANGIERPLNIGTANGMTVIVDDGVPVVDDAYTTYMLGAGVLLNADGRVDVPVEVAREAATNGGQETLYTRKREVIHPNGFSFILPEDDWTESPTDAQLFDPKNWKRKYNAKALPLAKIITRDGVVAP